MSLLQLPEQFKGPWDHALILTYGLNVPFFERTLWRQFAARCRNKILLADGRHYLEKCADYAQDRRVYHMNQSYVAGGIFAPRAAHAKVILLTNSEQGRLLIGSGNLNWQGYASGGELFTQYEYKADKPDSLAAFLSVRELLEGLMKSGYLDPITESHITLLCEQTPWLYSASPSAERPVRHNLSQSFLDQLYEVIGGDAVEELWIATPFYDKEVAALERLLMTFQPQQTTLLIQPEHTSIDPDALQQVLGRVATRCIVRPFHMRDVDAYVHAKLFLFKLADRAVCLQGSPNLSRVAMLFPASLGNIEVANLLSGHRRAFDDLLDAFIIDPATTSISALNVSYQGSDFASQSIAPLWYLISGEWLGEQLVLSFRGSLPNLQDAVLLIGVQEFALNLGYCTAQQMELRLSAEAAAQLQRPVPLAIRWNEGTTVQQSNPIFVCNKAALSAILDTASARLCTFPTSDL